MHIVVPMPAEAEIEKINSWQHMLDVVGKRLEALEPLAHRAFSENDYASWVKAQEILYHWNCESFHSRQDSQNLLHNAKMILRNYLVSYEQKELNKQHPVILDCFSDFTADRAIEELKNKAKAHPINKHPYLLAMQQYGLPQDKIRLFMDNWNTDSYIFHLYIAAQSINTPFEIRAELYYNLYQELGEGDIARAHPIIYAKNYQTLGKSIQVHPLPESLYVFNTQVYYTLLCGAYEKGLGGLGFIEVNVPEQVKMIYEGLKKSGMPEDDIEFWPLHISLDSEHGDAWFEEMRQIMTTPAAALAALEGGTRVLDARMRIFDGLYAATFNDSLKQV